MGSSQSASDRLKSKAIQIDKEKGVESAVNQRPTIPIGDGTAHKLEALNNGQIEVDRVKSTNLSSREASLAWFQQCVNSLTEDKSMPEGFRESAAVKLAQKAAQSEKQFSMTGAQNKIEHYNYGSGSHMWVIIAFEKAGKSKVNFFLSTMRLECADSSEDLLGAELIRRHLIGYDRQTDTYKYITG